MDAWINWYKDVKTDAEPSAFMYGDTPTYSKGYAWLKPCAQVEDWGCGMGGFKRMFTEPSAPQYIGVDGTRTPFVSKQVDLTTYTSTTEGLFMRHVLEHNYAWQAVLRNACRSFTKRMCLVLFTPFSTDSVTKQLAHNAQHGVDVPDLSLPLSEITQIFAEHKCSFTLETLATPTGYGIEHVFRVYKD